MKNPFLLLKNVLMLLLLWPIILIGQEESIKKVDHIIYLIGDAGRPAEDSKPVFDLLEKHVGLDDFKSTVVFLGDNIYPGGMPDKEEEGREEAEQIIDGQIERLKELNIELYYIPGNHDWNKGKKNGIEHVRNEEKYIQKKMDEGNVFVPNRGCPGPVKIKLDKDIILYAIDTQWWLHQYEKPPIEEADCIVRTREEFIGELKDELVNNSDKNIIVVGHNPIYSDGNHGGYFQFKDHIFPLRAINKGLYIPLPIIGSFYPYYRSTIGHNTDIINPDYHLLKEGLLDAFEDIDHLVYAAGHEHTLQYYNKNNQHFIVSGSGGETTYASGKGDVEFSDAKQGLFKLIYYKDGSVFMQAIETDESSVSVIAFEKEIREKNDIDLIVEYEIGKDLEEFPDSIIKAPGPQFKASKAKEFFWGKHYRKAWVTPISFEVLNLYTERGGLLPVKMGGRLQSKSLRVESKDGSQYVLRSMRKFPERVLPDDLQNTVAANILADQISAAHPYAAFVIPPLADAAKILHTNPRAAYIPDSPNLLHYRKDFANELVLYEQRAAHDLSKLENFGFAKDAIKSSDLVDELLDNNDVIVDEQEVLRNRLFDMIIGDWDRHEDQWRWAEFKCEKENHRLCTHIKGVKKYYVPIPKDRDQAFALFDGVFPWITSRKWLLPLFQSFDYEIKNVQGLNFNGRYVDRFFLTRPSKKDWVNMAEELKLSLSDEVIDNAIKLWPDTIYQLDGEVISAKIKARRDKMPEYAAEYYEFLAKTVNVLGTKEKEEFIIERLNNDSTRIRIYTIKKDKANNLYYDRTFIRSETKEIMIYGLGGRDNITISGDVKNGILLRVIGGYGKDQITDSSRVAGIRKLTQVYDTEKKTLVASGKETRVHTSKEKSSNLYNMKEYKPNVLSPNAFLGSNPDDGLFIGGGISYVKQGFRKDPYKAKHRILANVAFKTFSFNALYTGEFVDVIGKADFRLDVLVNNPKLTNFFGYGNLTSYDFNNANREDYVMRFNAISARGLFVFNSAKAGVFRLGAQYSNLLTVDSPEQYNNENAGINQTPNDESQYAGITADYEYSIKNKKVLPTRGMFFSAGVKYNHELTGKNISNAKLQSKLTLYFPIYHALTYVANISGTTVVGDFEYYHSASLGGRNYTKDNDVLRGYRRDRFNGRSSFAFNNELRWKLFKFKTSLFPGQFGINAFVDVGRVWVDGEESVRWHNNYGGGIWVSPMDIAVISAYYSFSDEENMFKLLIGFLF